MGVVLNLIPTYIIIIYNDSLTIDFIGSIFLFCLQTKRRWPYVASWRPTGCLMAPSAQPPKNTSWNLRRGMAMGRRYRTTVLCTDCRTYPARSQPVAVAGRRHCANAGRPTAATRTPRGWWTRRTTRKVWFWCGRRMGPSWTGAGSRPPARRPCRSPTGMTRTTSARYWWPWLATRLAATWWWTTVELTIRSKTARRGWVGSSTTGRPRACCTCRPTTCSTRSMAGKRRASKSWLDTCRGWMPFTGTLVS